jgi:hypothetical protein
MTERGNGLSQSRGPARRAGSRGRAFPWHRLAWLPLAMTATAFAQTPPADVNALLGSARLGAGYAQMLGLASTPDIAAASYDISASDSSPTLDVFRLPYQARLLALTPDSDLYWRVAGGYLKLRDEFSFTPAPTLTGAVATRWSAYSASAGVLAKIRLGAGFTFEPAIDIALARLENSASYSGAASLLQPLLDGPLFNWRTNAWLITPSLALAWARPIDDAKLSVRGHVARSWISSFDESASLQSFNEAANAYSIRADYAWPTGYRIAGREMYGVATAGFAGFFGANRDALGFTSVAELGGGVELPFRAGDSGTERVRLTAAYLYGSDVHGWTVGLSLQY